MCHEVTMMWGGTEAKPEGLKTWCAVPQLLGSASALPEQAPVPRQPWS